MSAEEKRTKNSIKRILKKFPQYKRIDNIDDADLAIIHHADDIEKFQVSIINSSNKEKFRNETSEKIKIFYLKHKNQRNKKQLIISDVGKNHFLIQR